MNEFPNRSRRSFLTNAVPAAGLILLPGAASLAAEDKKKGGGDEDVSTNEDLMREHGILKRVLLAYDEIIRRVRASQDFPPEAVTAGATIIRKFVEDYHEKLEEEHLFPRFRKAGKLTSLVDTLLAQHQAGRRLTDRVLSRASGGFKSQDDRNQLAADLAAFNRMYAPHEAREDTVLFPALHKIVSEHEYDAMGEQFEKIERTTFGGDGFDIYLDKVEALEKQLNIYDLAQFTPKV
ncbi:hemerythrin domain-containing protein [Occallatibacter riparius]|uniref:Hemerythrin domain-containing protein n=1 Tax=Occallatibacter riparius TaxID=1002689 RepID=A0A9J7BYJ9_9BACT|nr:hemerythrin domain-containing protein [Occallatibacter riparius]UWZ86366.1 hemerythrin domain-containing protein [Occallatibacter riparius]